MPRAARCLRCGRITERENCLCENPEPRPLEDMRTEIQLKETGESGAARRDFAKWYNDNELGGCLMYIAEIDEFQLHDGEKWNYITESILRTEFKAFLTEQGRTQNAAR